MIIGRLIMQTGTENTRQAGGRLTIQIVDILPANSKFRPTNPINALTANPFGFKDRAFRQPFRIESPFALVTTRPRSGDPDTGAN
jgi:hypothetical protein